VPSSHPLRNKHKVPIGLLSSSSFPSFAPRPFPSWETKEEDQEGAKGGIGGEGPSVPPPRIAKPYWQDANTASSDRASSTMEAGRRKSGRDEGGRPWGRSQHRKGEKRVGTVLDGVQRAKEVEGKGPTRGDEPEKKIGTESHTVDWNNHGKRSAVRQKGQSIEHASTASLPFSRRSCNAIAISSPPTRRVGVPFRISFRRLPSSSMSPAPLHLLPPLSSRLHSSIPAVGASARLAIVGPSGMGCTTSTPTVTSHDTGESETRERRGGEQEKVCPRSLQFTWPSPRSPAFVVSSDSPPLSPSGGDDESGRTRYRLPQKVCTAPSHGTATVKGGVPIALVEGNGLLRLSASSPGRRGVWGTPAANSSLGLRIGRCHHVGVKVMRRTAMTAHRSSVPKAT